MEFSRVGEHTIRCVISEQEIEEMGYSLEDLMTNSEKSQTFMNQIFDMAEQEFQMNFDLGIRTVRADFLPDHNISLTFSEHQGSSAMLDHLKDIVNNMLSSIPEQCQENLKMEAQKNEKMQIDAELDRLKDPDLLSDDETVLGAYAVFVHYNGDVYDGMLYVGKRPTLHNDPSVSIEVNIFDFDEDLYNKTLTVEFIDFIRGDEKFTNVEDLIASIHGDQERVKARLKQEKERI